MIRRINWANGDSAPVYGHITASVDGTGELRIVLGFPVTSAQVSFARSYFYSDLYDYGHGFPPECYVSGVDDEGFTVTYTHIPDYLDINYMAM